MKFFYFILILFLLIIVVIAYPKKMTDFEVSNRCCFGYLNEMIKETKCESNPYSDLYMPCTISNIKTYSCFGLLGCNYKK